MERWATATLEESDWTWAVEAGGGTAYAVDGPWNVILSVARLERALGRVLRAGQLRGAGDPGPRRHAPGIRRALADDPARRAHRALPARAPDRAAAVTRRGRPPAGRRQPRIDAVRGTERRALGRRGGRRRRAARPAPPAQIRAGHRGARSVRPALPDRAVPGKRGGACRAAVARRQRYTAGRDVTMRAGYHLLLPGDGLLSRVPPPDARRRPSRSPPSRRSASPTVWWRTGVSMRASAMSPMTARATDGPGSPRALDGPGAPGNLAGQCISPASTM